MYLGLGVNLHRTGSGDTGPDNGVVGRGQGVGTGSGAVELRQTISGAGNASGAGSGAVLLRQTISGDGNGSGTGAGAVAATAGVSGAGTGTGTGSGDVRWRQSISGDGAGVGTGAGAVTLQQSISGDGNGTGTGSGDVAIGGGSGLPTPATVTFDGTNDYLERGAGLTGAADTDKFTLLIEGISTSATGTKNLFVSQIARVRVRWRNDGAFEIRLRNSSATEVLEIRSSTGYDDGSPHDLMVSYDGVAGTGQLYVDGVSDIAVNTTETTGTVDMTEVNWGVLTAPSGSRLLLNGDIKRITCWDDVALDISSASVRTDILDVDEASTLGNNIVDIFGAASDWNAGTNHGSGGDFTMTGAVV